MSLSRDDILNADDLETREVPVPQWGGSVLVKALSGEERDAWEGSLTVRRPATYGPNKGQLENVADLANMRAKLVARAIVGDDGERLFTDADIVALGKKSAAALQTVFTVASEMSGLDEDAAEAAEGNSEAAQSGASTSNELTQPASQ